jgi:hypothetical protein
MYMYIVSIRGVVLLNYRKDTVLSRYVYEYASVVTIVR